MKKLLLILFCLPLLTLAQKTYVPDGCFEIFLENNAMGDGIYGNDSVLTSNIMNVLTLNIANPCANNIITDVTGLEDFTALEYLSVNFSGITSIDLSQNYYLEGLSIDETLIDSLDCSNNPLLTDLSANNCNLTFIDISQSTSLIELRLAVNFLTSLNLSNHTALRYLDVKFNNLTSLDLRNIDINNFTGMYNHPIWTGSYNATLETTGNYQLSCIDVDNPSLADSLIPVNYFGIESFHNFSSDCDAISGCTDTLALNFDSIAIYENYTCIYGKTFVPDDNFEAYLEAIGLGDSINSNDSVLTVNIITVQNLFVNNQNISDLTGIENFIELQHLECESNSLTVLDLSNNTQLRSVKCVNNQLTNLELNLNNTYLNDIYCQNNLLTNLDVSGLFLFNLNCSNNQLNSLNLKNIISIPAFNPLQLNSTNNLNLYCIDVDNPLAVMFLSSVYIDPWTSFDTNCVIALGCIDSLANNYDSTATINDGSCYYGKTYVPDDNFEAYLEANGMGDGIMLNDSVLTGNINTVTYLNVDNQNISNLTGIEDCTALTNLECNWNQLTSLDVSNNIALIQLDCSYNQLTSLDVSNNTFLYYLYCFYNQLTSLDVSSNTALLELEFISNQLTTLDVSSNTALQQLDCNNNQLTSIDLRNHSLQNLSLSTQTNPNLFCIDVDNPILAQALLTAIDPWTSFDTNCVTALGCTDSTACNYMPNATVDDGSCLIVYGCTDSLACNYNSTAQCDDGLCLTLYGCTDTLACNYDSNAQCDDGGCTYLSVTLNNNQVICSNFSNATLTVNYNTGSYTYLWSNGETTQSIDTLAMGSYSVIVTDSVGCSTTLNANVTLAPAPASNMFPEICYVTVDSTTGNNKVIIKPMANLLTSKFIIYKESSANIYSPIDTINSNILEHLDISSNPMAQSYRYKISVLDTCSNESVKSDFHKTIHLTMSLGLNGEVNLLWNNYEGYQPSDYLIFRSLNNGAMNQVGILPGTNLAFTDLTPPSGILNYQVRAIAPNCNIIPFAKNSTIMLVSNVINHSTTAVNELVNSKKVIKITDLLGRETKQTNQPLFYIYDDGTVEKRIVIEQ